MSATRNQLMASTLEFDKPVFVTAAQAEPEPQKPTMLIVDDEDGVRDSLRVIFKDDFELLLAADGDRALEQLAGRHVDVAVLDIRMAGMSGIELLEQVKQRSPDTEVVMMTAFETNDTLRQALRLRASDYVNKPFDIVDLRKAVNTAMERRGLNREFRASALKLTGLQTELQQLRIEDGVIRERGKIYEEIIHDINGPLTIISGLVQMINQRMGEETRMEGEQLETVKDRLARITRQVTNCIDISRRYLSFLRQHPSEPARVWVNQILVDLGELLRLHPACRNHKLLIHPFARDVLAQINGTDLIQILLNLTLNALQCSPTHHQVEIRSQLLEQPLDLSLFPNGEHDQFINRDGFTNLAPLLALSVEDNGPGIAPESLPKIFEAYYTTQPRGLGTGLGLCIVQRLINTANGAIYVHSTVGKGTAFTVYLPTMAVGNDPNLARPDASATSSLSA